MKYLKHFNNKDINHIYRHGIYRLYFENKPNKSYIGSTIGRYGFYGRLSTHILTLRKNLGSRILQNHFNKYGEDSLCIEIIEICEKTLAFKELYEIETYYIKQYNCYPNGLNGQPEATSLNNIQSCVTKELISKKKSVPYFVYHKSGDFYKQFSSKKEMCLFFKSKPSYTKTHKTYIINNCFVFKEYRGHKLDISKYWTIICYDKAGNFIKGFVSTQEVMEDLDLTKKQITNLFAVFAGKRTCFNNKLWVRKSIDEPFDLKIQLRERKQKDYFVFCYDSHGIYVGTFNHLSNAEFVTKVNRKLIHKGIKSKYKYSSGYFWSTHKLTQEELENLIYLQSLNFRARNNCVVKNTITEHQLFM